MTVKNGSWVQATHPTNAVHCDRHSSHEFTHDLNPRITIGRAVYFANAFLDLLLYDFFFSRARDKVGFYVDIGAADGVDASNTAFFDYCLGWRGLLVEGSICADCRLPVDRPNATVFPSFLKGSFSQSKGPSGVWRDTPGSGCGKVETPATQRCMSSDLTRRPIRTLDAILRSHSITHIDLLSIDVEAEGVAALKSLDLTRVSVAVIVLEGNGVRHLQQQGYYVSELRTVHGDWLAWRPDLLRAHWNWNEPAAQLVPKALPHGKLTGGQLADKAHGRVFDRIP